MCDFVCDCCGEEYDVSLRFKVVGTIEGVEVNEYDCPDCIGSLFIEDPEQVSKITIMRCP